MTEANIFYIKLKHFLKCCILCIVQLRTHVRLFATQWTAACRVSLSISSSRSLLKLMSNILVYLNFKLLY